MKVHSQFFHIQWERQNFQLKRHSLLPEVWSSWDGQFREATLWSTIGVGLNVDVSIRIISEHACTLNRDSVPFRLLVFGMAIYSLGVSASRATVYLRLYLGLAQSRHSTNNRGMHKQVS